MYTFRYNPIVKRWVLLGGAINQTLHITQAHLLSQDSKNLFVAATYPRQPFIIEPPEKVAHSEGLVHAEQPPVGEYELLLYKGKEGVFSWKASEWENWLQLLQNRLLQVYHNPYLHHVQFTLLTALENTVPEYKRVGDLVATSYPIAGQPDLLPARLANRIREREAVFTLYSNEWGSLQIPSAPTHHEEVWYLPHEAQAGVEAIPGKELKGLAETLYVLFTKLHKAYPDHQYVLEIHSGLQQQEEETTWWLQLYRYQPHVSASALSIQPLPELVMQQLRYVWGS